MKTSASTCSSIQPTAKSSPKLVFQARLLCQCHSIWSSQSKQNKTGYGPFKCKNETVNFFNIFYEEFVLSLYIWSIFQMNSKWMRQDFMMYWNIWFMTDKRNWPVVGYRSSVICFHLGRRSFSFCCEKWRGRGRIVQFYFPLYWERGVQRPPESLFLSMYLLSVSDKSHAATDPSHTVLIKLSEWVGRPDGHFLSSFCWMPVFCVLLCLGVSIHYRPKVWKEDIPTLERWTWKFDFFKWQFL